jgi:ABC-2 type transport system ATP-binding protein
MVRVLVETRALTKIYGPKTALDHCDLEIPQGEVLGLLGPNGAGKTTLLRLLMGYLRPSGGRATIDGLDCYHQSVAVHHRVAYLPGDARLFGQMRGREVLRFFCEVRRESDLSRALDFAERLELDLSGQVASFSTGMRQKLALAAVLAADTPLLILDEPTANLDPTVRSDVVAIVREAQQAGRTVIFSSHVMDEVEDACSRVCILRKGKLVHTQTMGELLRQHRITARITGALPPVPARLAGEIQIHFDGPDSVRIETPGELSPLLGWLATLPLAEVRIEPFRLRSIYDRFHGAEVSDGQ